MMTEKRNGITLSPERARALETLSEISEGRELAVENKKTSHLS